MWRQVISQHGEVRTEEKFGVEYKGQGGVWGLLWGQRVRLNAQLVVNMNNKKQHFWRVFRLVLFGGRVVAAAAVSVRTNMECVTLVPCERAEVEVRKRMEKSGGKLRMMRRDKISHITKRGKLSGRKIEECKQNEVRK